MEIIVKNNPNSAAMLYDLCGALSLVLQCYVDSKTISLNDSFILAEGGEPRTVRELLKFTDEQLDKAEIN